MMKKILVSILGLSISASASAVEKLIIVNEGIWYSDNGRLTYFEDGNVVSNQWFRDVNGHKLGDTPCDIISVSDNLIAVSVNWSNIVQFMTPDGKAVGATEDVPNCRKLASDGRYVYVSSYGHECMTEQGLRKFTKGFVAKIDTETFNVTDAVEVGYEPEGIALYDGFLFVANTGGYAFQENHDYEKTVTVIDAAKMAVVRTIDTGEVNLYGKLSKSGEYLCINAAGDLYDIPAATVIMDCRAAIDGKADEDCFVSLPYAATYSCTAADGRFYAVGSRYSYIDGDYKFNYITVNPEQVMSSRGESGVQHDFPGTVLADIEAMSMPYGIYVNPYTGYIYATDAAGFVEGGSLYQWSPDGVLQGKHAVYINPGHFLALQPGDSGIPVYEYGDEERNSSPIYNLQGIRINTPNIGEVYIRDGKKYVNR